MLTLFPTSPKVDELLKRSAWREARGSPGKTLFAITAFQIRRLYNKFMGRPEFVPVCAVPTFNALSLLPAEAVDAKSSKREKKHKRNSMKRVSPSNALNDLAVDDWQRLALRLKEGPQGLIAFYWDAHESRRKARLEEARLLAEAAEVEKLVHRLGEDAAGSTRADIWRQEASNKGRGLLLFDFDDGAIKAWLVQQGEIPEDDHPSTTENNEDTDQAVSESQPKPKNRLRRRPRRSHH